MELSNNNLNNLLVLLPKALLSNRVYNIRKMR